MTTTTRKREPKAPISDLIRIAEVMALTGWDRHYVHKLAKAGVLTLTTLSPGGWPWYYRTQVLALVKLPGNA